MWVCPGRRVAAASAMSIYLAFAPSYTITYGAFAGVIVTLLFFYITGAIVIYGAEVNAAHKNGFTALIDASNHGRRGLVKRLIKLGANVNAVTRDGFCAMHYAIARNHRRVVNELLKAGAEVNVQARNGETPLDLAIKHKRVELQALLEDRGAVRGR